MLFSASVLDGAELVPVYEIAGVSVLEEPGAASASASMSMGGGMHGELGALLPAEEADAVAVRSGLWSDASTWGGVVPGEGMSVLVPSGVYVIYDVASDVSYRGVRVDGGGTFAFRSDVDTRLVVDTFVAMPGSVFSMGNDSGPIAEGVRAELLIDASAGPITDPTKLGRGLLTHGETWIVGADKTAYLPLAVAPRSGDERLVFLGGAQGWLPGDILVLTGTSYDANGSDEANTRFHDEVLEIVSVELVGQRQTVVTFINRTNDAADGLTSLLWDHAPPEGYGDWQLHVYGANMTRNVEIRTLEAESVPTQERGHVMLMHSAEVVVRHASFTDLGRTDKNRLIDDPVVNVDGTVGVGSNPRGRYALHLHRLGAGDLSSTPALVTGNVVWGSPGWGVVHHDSHAVLEENVVFDVVGTAIASEDGNEIGRWSRNLTIKTTGDDRWQQDFDLSPRVPLFDFGFNGEGYWVQGAGQVLLEDNIAASAAGAGFMLFSNVDGMRSVKIPSAVLDDPAITQGLEEVDAFNVPARGIVGSTTINSLFGLVTWGHMRNQDGEGVFTFGQGTPAHRLRTTIEGFRFWAIHGEGIFSQYTSQVDFVDGLILGDLEDPVAYSPNGNGDARGRGFAANAASKSLLYEGLTVGGFEIGMWVLSEGIWNLADETPARSSAMRVVNSTFTGVERAMLRDRGGTINDGLVPEYLVLDGVTFETIEPVSDVVVLASFTYELLASRSFGFDARGSLSLDPLGDKTNGIVSYAWDFDGDGEADAYGSRVRHVFEGGGVQTVTLTVTDLSGRRAALSEVVYADDASSYDPLGSAGFEGAGGVLVFPGWREPSNGDEGLGWVGYGWRSEGGRAVKGVGDVAFPDHARSMSLVVRDEGVTVGAHQLVFEAGSVEAVGPDNDLRVVVFGVNGDEFHFDRGSTESPALLYGLGGAVDALLSSGDLIGEAGGDGSYSLEVDFGSGYEFIVVAFVAADVNVPGGDVVWVDDVRLRDAVVVESTPRITSEILPAVARGLAYEHLIQVQGGNGVLAWSADPSSLPEGLVLGVDGVITGTTTATPGVYGVEVTVMDEDGGLATDQIELVVLDHPVLGGSGLRYEVYRHNGALSVEQAFGDGVLIETGITDRIHAGLKPEGVSDNYAIRFYGHLLLDSSGYVGFATESDNGSVLRIDGHVVIDNDSVQGVISRSGGVYLEAGHHDVEILYFEQTGGEFLDVTISGPDGVHVPLTDARVFPPAVPGGVSSVELEFEEGKSIDHALFVPGGWGVKRWSLVEGVLPAGLILTEAGALRGSVSEARDVELLIRVTDGLGQRSDQWLMLSVVPASQGTRQMIGAVPAWVEGGDEASLFGL
ncbi:MAG: PKD domain-containing protein [Phycisphaeraceae bacterium]